MIGMGERTTPQAVLIIARALFRAGSASQVLAVHLPKSRSYMRFDTVITRRLPHIWLDRVRLLTPFQVNRALLDASANPKVKFMHCLPRSTTPTPSSEPRS
jgi:hypothetical protein